MPDALNSSTALAEYKKTRLGRTRPPPVYNVANLPDFLKSANAGTKIVSAPPMTIGAGTVDADVDPANPKTIEVRQPDAFTQPVQTHESAHVYQLSRNHAFVDSIFKAALPPTPATFDYGGVDGLLAAQAAHKSIEDFNPEQQATMASDYQRLTEDAIRRGDTAALARVTAAFHPILSQLAKIPPAGANMTQMTAADLHPAAPGPPPSTVAGMPMLPDPLVGGPARYGR